MSIQSSLTSFIKTRRSIRIYQDKPIPKEIIEDIIDCARLAPTANNKQLWEFIVITETEMKNKIAGMTNYGKFIARAPVCIAMFCNDTKYYLEDGSAATENILLAAWVYGIGSCWVAGDKKDYANDVRKLLGAPESYKLISLVSLGFPAESPKLKKRPLKELLHWERF